MDRLALALAAVALGVSRLDGRLDESEWALSDSISDFTQKEPVEGATPS